MPANENTKYPFTAFNFAVEINVPGVSSKICSAAFSECDGLDMTMEVKTIREGGNSSTQYRLAGPVAYGQLSLKRGMTGTFDLWDWFNATLNNARLRADAEVVMFAGDGRTERARFILKRCLPVKVKAPSMNAKDGMIAIEELQIAYESMRLKRPSGGLSLGISAGAGIGAEASIGVEASFSAGASIEASASLDAGASIEVGASIGGGASIGIGGSSGSGFTIG
jgi:phage tail-like protein